MSRRRLLGGAALGSLAALLPHPVAGAAFSRVRRLAVLGAGRDREAGVPDAQRRTALLWQGLGWRPGENLLIERRYAEHDVERLAGMADELARLGPDVVMALSCEGAVAAARAMPHTPIVFFAVLLPLESGLVASYARPGVPRTGIALTAGAEVGAKRLQWLRELAPAVRRLAFVLPDPQAAYLVEGSRSYADDVRTAAASQGLEITLHTARRPADVPRLLDDAAAAGAQALMGGCPALIAQRERVAGFALRHRWPTATLAPEMFEGGLLMYHGPSQHEFGRMLMRAFGMVDRLLRGARAEELPVELPNQYELVLNQGVARRLGIALPTALLLQADRLVG